MIVKLFLPELECMMHYSLVGQLGGALLDRNLAVVKAFQP